VAGADTAFAKDRKDALANAWRLALNRAQSAPAVQEVPVLRVRRDSITRTLAADSVVLAKIVAASQARKARRGTLAPADQRVFTRDSATRAQAMASGRTERAAALAQLAADSAALAGAFAPAIAALSDFVAAYPDAVDAATWLATLDAESGRSAEAVAVFDTLAAHAHGLDPSEVLATGERLVNQGLYRAGSRALALALERNPYNRGALYALGIAYYQLHDSTHLLPVAKQLWALDPLNRATLRLVATGWDLRGRRDSTLAYLARADTGLAVEVVVSAFVKGPSDADFTALATNHKSVPSPPLHLTVEFLDEHGQVIATLPYDVPSLPPGATHEIDLKASGKGIAGWRYRAS
jgi:tetratricopeptide (TPR) repeat protein